MVGLSRTAADALVAKLYGQRRNNLDVAICRYRASQHPAARLILLCESELGVERNAFRAVLAEAVLASKATGSGYFLRHPNVFRDWLYGFRAVPPWASRLVCDLGRGLLRASWVRGRARRSLHRCLTEMVADLAGGEDQLEWLLSVQDEIGTFPGRRRL